MNFNYEYPSYIHVFLIHERTIKEPGYIHIGLTLQFDKFSKDWKPLSRTHVTDRLWTVL